MAVKFNPFTGQLQIDEKGSGGGSSYIDGEVATYNDLPLDGTAPLNSAWLVREASGIWPVSRKQAGIYIRTATAGSSRDADYTYAGTMPDVFSDAVFALYDEASTTRTGQFNLGNITAGQNRVLTWPDGNGTIARTSDIPTTFAASAISDSTSAGRALLTAADASAQRTSLGLGSAATSASTAFAAATHVHGAADITSGVFDNARINFAAPTSIGSTTPNSGTFTTLNVNGTGSADLVAEFGTSAAGRNNEIQIWGNGAGRNHVIAATAAAGLVFRVAAGGNHTFLSTSGIRTASGLDFGWSSTSNANGSADTTIFRDAADTVAQRRTTNPQAYRIYNTTDAGLTNFERGFMRWSSNVLQIGTEAGGTGSARALEFQTGGTTRLTLNTGGNAIFGGIIATNASVQLSSNFTMGAQSAASTLNCISNPAAIRLFGLGADAGTGSTNTERLHISTRTGASYFISTQATGTGTVRALELRTNDVARLTLEAAGGLTIADANDIAVGTTTGTKIGTGTTQRLGFWNATPAVQPAAVADATDAATTQARLNDLLARLRTIGLIAT